MVHLQPTGGGGYGGGGGSSYGGDRGGYGGGGRSSYSDSRYGGGGGGSYGTLLTREFGVSLDVMWIAPATAASSLVTFVRC